ncbi:MAG: hypothetical protein SH808_03105 [Saprospiraceae bacterium]|mgnify:CR=1 FL=1|nr:hypothetical protein [Saprospiraceae bacterium]
MKSNQVCDRMIWLVIALAIGLGSCNIINPEEPKPTVVHLQPFAFHIESGQGSGTNKITETWVNANGNFLGVFTPPVDIYYLDQGETRFTFYPGIRNNGIASDPIQYPMFAVDSFEFLAGEGVDIEIQPVTSYRTGTVFSLLADFELTNAFTDNRDTVSASELIRSSVDVFEGQYAGQIVLSQEAFFIEVGHTVPMSGLPADGKPSYLELRYKSEIEFSIGILGIALNGQSSSNFFYLVRPSPEWNMLYIELTDKISESDFPAYKILFRSLYPTGSPEPQYNIFLDNIKVVHL